MSDLIRRLYNKVDSFFDRRALTREMSFSRRNEYVKLPSTAGSAYQDIKPVVQQLNRGARLKSIISQQGVNQDGTSSHWEFFFDLPDRRAKLVCDWVLPWDETSDSYMPVKLDFNLTPFPPLDSPVRHLVREGKLLHRQMITMWRHECKHLPDLPNKFRDTDSLHADFLQQGLDVTKIEFSLRTGQSLTNQLCWIAETRHVTYYADFV